MGRLRKLGKLVDLDVAAAAHLHHGFEQIDMMMVQDGRVTNHHHGEWREILGLAEIARQRHPDANVETVGDLIALGEESIRDEIDTETGDSP